MQEHPHDHDHSRPDAHDHNHDHAHDHDHHHGADSWWEKIAMVLHLPGYGHSHGVPTRNDAIYNNELGIRTVKQALLLLGLTTLLQIVIFIFSGSVALLADTVHNLGDALNSVPLWIAFVLARRGPSRRFTYGYGRAEDIAGLLIVVSIAFSAGYIFYEAIGKLLNPQLIEFGGWVVAAALTGFIGNEAVAVLQIRVGRQIGSEAMITDGRHARIDGLTSLIVIPAVIGSYLGWPILDPILGIVIGIAIVFIARDAIVAMWYRMMDAVDPHLLEHAEAALNRMHKVQRIKKLRMRWVGHALFLETHLVLDGAELITSLSRIRNEIQHELESELPNLEDSVIVFYEQ
jgi:cation diffusion facilitator family transporter